MKNVIKQFIPPILLGGLRELRRRSTYAKIGADSHSRPRLTDETYQLKFKRVDLGSEVHFVPGYAIHRPACQEIIAGRYYEPLSHILIGALLDERPGDLIHAGTFFGDMLPSFSKKCFGMVYAFEPVLENYILAKLCVQQNELSNVILWNVGLGRDISTARIDTGEKASHHHGGASRIGESGQLTSLLCIDSLGLKDVSVIQLDVEGFELDALKGAVQTIQTCKPTVLIEDNSNNCAPFLEGLGYVYIGRIPGLAVWTEKQHASGAKGILQSL